MAKKKFHIWFFFRFIRSDRNLKGCVRVSSYSLFSFLLIQFQSDLLNQVNSFLCNLILTIRWESFKTRLSRVSFNMMNNEIFSINNDKTLFFYRFLFSFVVSFTYVRLSQTADLHTNRNVLFFFHQFCRVDLDDNFSHHKRILMTVEISVDLLELDVDTMSIETVIVGLQNWLTSFV